MLAIAFGVRNKVNTARRSGSTGFDFSNWEITEEKGRVSGPDGDCGCSDLVIAVYLHKVLEIRRRDGDRKICCWTYGKRGRC